MKTQTKFKLIKTRKPISYKTKDNKIHLKDFPSIQDFLKAIEDLESQETSPITLLSATGLTSILPTYNINQKEYPNTHLLRVSG